YKDKFNLDFLDVTEEKDTEAPIILAGTRLERKDSDTLWDELKAASNRMNTDAAPVDEDEPWKTPGAADLDKRSVKPCHDAPSVWKKIQFRPALPADLQPQMGTNVKFLAAVKGPFWKDKGLAPDSLSDGDICMTWDATDGQEGEDKGACLTAFSGGPAAEAC